MPNSALEKIVAAAGNGIVARGGNALRISGPSQPFRREAHMGRASAIDVPHPVFHPSAPT